MGNIEYMSLSVYENVMQDTRESTPKSRQTMSITYLLPTKMLF